MCTPRSCGIDCGSIDDGCGGTLDCGSCPDAGSCHDDIANGDETGVDCGGSCRPCRQSPDIVGVYPQGARFALALLATDFGATPAMLDASACGWNIAHTYYEPWRDTEGVSVSFMNAAADAGFATLTSLNAQGTPAAPLDEATMSAAIAARAAAGRVAFWDLPEEMRYWYPTEMSVVTSYAAWTRAYDPQQRPNLMYIPGHYGGDAVASYVPYLDVVPSSCYASYSGQPHAWVRWRMETTVQAIADAGFPLGASYLGGEKTPAAYLELYTGSTGLTPEASYHDFWQSIVSGARVILIYSMAYKDSTPELTACWQRLCDAARQLTGPEDVEEAVLYGTPLSTVTAEVLSGPARTPTFTPDSQPPVDYDSLDLLAVRFDGEVFVIVVSSAEQDVTGRISGLPPLASADVLFEGRTIALAGDALEDTFTPLGVHVYRVVEAH